MAITAKRFFDPQRPPPSREVEDRFFTDLRTRNATFKTTDSDRFNELDARCIECFVAARAQIDEVLDIGISSGSTTLALSDALRAAGYSGKIVGTDIAVMGYLVNAYPGVRVLTDEAGHPLQYDLLGRAIKPWRRRADYATGMLLVRAVANSMLGNHAQQMVEQGKDKLRAVRLISPRARNHPMVRIEQNDIFTPTPGFRDRFSFVRAANILNRGYFDEAALRRAMANIVSYLTGPGAFILLARSAKGRHVGTLFQVTADGHYLDVVDRFCGGSEVEWLMLETKLPVKWAL